jgi:hypothetical protein
VTSMADVVGDTRGLTELIALNAGPQRWAHRSAAVQLPRRSAQSPPTRAAHAYWYIVSRRSSLAPPAIVPPMASRYSLLAADSRR